jgi:hypothetical protein
LLIKSINFWLIPNHLTISAFYFITFSAYLIHQLKLYQTLASRKKQFTPTDG